MTKDILFIMTGGTIDAEAYADPKHPPKNAIPLKDSLVPMAVEELGYADDCRFFQWMMKDSKDFTEVEIYALSVFIKQRRANHIIMTHGTDRMAITASELSKQMAGSEKTIVITGSTVPLANGRGSDAPDNLRFAIETIEHLSAGVHVVMHCRHFRPGFFRKNLSTMRFEEIQE
jgi:L-asparaginase